MPLFSQSGFGFGRYGIADGGPIYNLPLSYYVGLLTSQYRLAPNLNKWVKAELGQLDDISTCLSTFIENFDIDTARGVQLDIVGEHYGQSRVMTFQPSGGASPVLDDETYRLLLRACDAKNKWDGRITSLNEIWASLFPGGTITIIDNQNMSATIVLSGSFTLIAQDLINNGLIVPRPETVQYTYTFTTLPMLGFDEDNSFIAGFDIGHFS